MTAVRASSGLPGLFSPTWHEGRWLIEGGARIDRVQVYTTARQTTETWATALTAGELEGIAQRARALGLVAEVHG